MRTPLLFLLLLTAAPAFAGVQAGLREGGKLFEEKKYGQALAAYNQILRDKPQDEAASFGAGAAAYYLKDYGSAEAAFKQAARQEGSLKEDALFNLGNAYYRAGDKKKAAEIYRQVILQNPKDKDAVHNLQLILEEQQNQNNNDNQNNQNQNQDSPNQSGGGAQNDQNSAGDQTQNSSQNQENKDAADRIMQMARENEYKKPQSAGAAQDDTVEKDW
ncbi:MAG: tetratricopeptide repeat protein [Elusimicrobiaceae bacterium]|nr:tetratricopeptide repeat protein [Elusimicrobiaceae bacterium]